MATHKKHVHFIGIGGIGVSALAQWYKSQNYFVTGTDAENSLITKKLQRLGITIQREKYTNNLINKKTSLIIYSAAIPTTHPDRILGHKLKISEMSYAQAIGQLTKKYKTIAIAGAHGKSTTTSLVALMMIRAGLDPTVIVGTKLKEFEQNNFRLGHSRWLILEADEFHASFLHYHPAIAIITNIDREHLDYYKSFSNIKKAFLKFFTHVSPRGFLIINNDNKNLAQLKISSPAKILNYSLKNPRAKIIAQKLKVPGQHNILNALACDKLGAVLGIEEKIRDATFSKFTGTWRRFDYKGQYRGAKLFDDYAHHPTEIKATLQGVRQMFPQKQIWCLFQPHLSSRLKLLYQDFLSSFDQAYQTFILETYRPTGRDKIFNTGVITAKKLALDLNRKQKTKYFMTSGEAVSFLRRHLKPNVILIIMGAGNVWRLTPKIKNP